MAFIKTIAVFFVTVSTLLFLVPFGCLGFVLSVLGLKKPMAWFMHKIAQCWARLLIVCTGCSVEVRNRENIPPNGGLCFVSNHGSIFDIVLALAYIGRPFGFIAKKELLLIPFLNMWIFLLGGFFIDRKQPRNALKTINSGIRSLKAGGCMLIFPEGRRSRGEGLLPFHPGSFKLATQSGVPVVPISITGSYDVFEKNRRVRAVPVRVVFGVPVATEDLPPENRKQLLADQVHAVVAAGLEG
ncbi:MAG: 1-acyl-sn-glycerol-3-phosphate acyltransferase [Treponema sp.]|jgi:1-acyl-sn-glycerol-3-phosphate acyltransferase|nr:1-acyl-sn-glycerol-3-phosphate acyltransferase [Treponema sp.]